MEGRITVIARTLREDGEVRVREFVDLIDLMHEVDPRNCFKITLWDESLAAVRHSATGLPDVPLYNTISYFGDHARFIVANGHEIYTAYRTEHYRNEQ